MNLFDRSGKRPGVTYACLYHSCQLCEGLRMAGGVVVGECGCQCHYQGESHSGSMIGDNVKAPATCDRPGA